ncbi:DUF6398 domain-containing protein [Ileibacterium valens]|uniref:DUF6398 domain-containing protein n=1 Tax=Ileibacterium valens TaxID=1862668 RepID=UPI00259B3FFE|nr:DUF6398 domain-containing protein [Ileibacterium valens]
MQKRPSPLNSGRPKTWAAGIIHALGSVNFLFDPSNPLYMSTADLADEFGLSKSTSVAKSSEIRKLLKMDYLTHEWILPSRLDDFTAIWMIEVNGFIFDARTLPYELQSIAYENGLIPYIPADRKEKADS